MIELNAVLPWICRRRLLQVAKLCTQPQIGDKQQHIQHYQRQQPRNHTNLLANPVHQLEMARSSPLRVCSRFKSKDGSKSSSKQYL